MILIRIDTKGAIAKLNRISKNQRRTKDNLRARLQQIWSIAAEEFVRAAMRKILVETGMSAASFFPLARAIKRVKAEQAIRGVISRKRGKGYTPSGYKRQKTRIGIPELPDGERSFGYQRPSAGRQRGEKAFIFRTGGTTRLNLQFSFTTLVYQLAYHENVKKNGAIDAGLEAFLDAVNRRRLEEIGNLTLEEWFGQRKFRRVRSPTGREII